MLAYRLMCRFLRLVVRVFFRQVEVVGLEHVPQDGAVIFAGNHPNSLIDPLLIITTCGRVVHFAAKDVLFRSRLFRPVLRALGAVPIARKTDHEGGALDNTSAFEALYGVLGTGRAMGIFPEGLSHNEAQLSRLKTGAARIAFGAAERYAQSRIRIVPCGLTYVHRKRFRSRALVQFGPPIDVDQGRLAEHAKDEQAAVRRLTVDIDTGLRALTVNAEDWPTLRVLDGVRRLYQPHDIALEDRIELARRFASVYPTVKDVPEVVALYGRMEGYLHRLEDAGLSDRDLRRPVGAAEALRRTALNVLLIGVWLPLALPGLVLHAPLGLMATVGGSRLSPRKDVVGTSKLIIGILGVLAVYVGLVGWVVWQYGWLGGALTTLLLPICGYATLRVLECTHSLRRLGRRLWRSARLGREAEMLRAERDALEAAVVVAVDRFRPAEMVPLFPRTM